MRHAHVAPAKRARPKLPPPHWRGASRAGAVSHLGMPRFMNTLPLLTLLTFLPFVGALMVVGLAQEKKQLARWLSLGFSLGGSRCRLRIGRPSISRAARLDSNAGCRVSRRRGWTRPAYVIALGHRGADGDAGIVEQDRKS